MIRSKDLERYIATIAQTLAGPVMNDLNSTPVKELTGIILILLSHIRTDLSGGEVAVGTILPEWEALRLQASRFIATAEPVAADHGLSGLPELDRELANIQNALSDRTVLEHFVAQLKDTQGDAKIWLKDMSAMLVKLTREYESQTEAALGTSPPTAASDRSSDLKHQLALYLEKRYSGLPSSPIEQFAIVSGGYSKVSALFTLKPNALLPRYLALRLDIPNTSTPMQLEAEYPVLKRAFELDLPVPEPILFEADESHIGGAFVISAQIRDAKLAGSPFVEDRRKHGANTAPSFGREAASLLAALHSRTYDRAATDTLVARERDQLLGDLSGTWREMDKSPFSLQRDLSIAWLYANPIPSGRPVCLVHGDFSQHNILTRDGTIAALLDWELAKIGDPAEDLAQSKMMLIGNVIEWDEFVQIYIESGGRPEACDPHAVAYYAALLFLKHGVYQTKIRNRFLKGESADLKDAYISSHLVDRLALYQAEALCNATVVSEY